MLSVSVRILKLKADILNLQAFIAPACPAPLEPPSNPTKCTKWVNEAYKSAMNFLEGSAKYLDAALKIHKNDPSLLYDRSAVAVQMLQILVSLKDNSTKDELEENKMNLCQQAVKYLAFLLRIKYNDARAWELLSLICGIHKLETQRIIAAARQHCLICAVEAEPNRGIGWDLLGIFYLRIGLPKMARAAFERGQSLQPDAEQLWIGQGIAGFTLLRPEMSKGARFEALALAKAAFSQALQAAEDAIDCTSSITLLGESFSSYVMHRLRAEVDNVADEVRKDLKLRTTQLVTALRAVEKLIELQPAEASARNLHGCLMELSHDRANAVKSFTIAQRILLSKGGSDETKIQEAIVCCNLARVLSSSGSTTKEKKDALTIIETSVKILAEMAMKYGEPKFRHLNEIASQCQVVLCLRIRNYKDAGRKLRVNSYP